MRFKGILFIVAVMLAVVLIFGISMLKRTQKVSQTHPQSQAQMNFVDSKSKTLVQAFDVFLKQVQHPTFELEKCEQMIDDVHRGLADFQNVFGGRGVLGDQNDSQISHRLIEKAFLVRAQMLNHLKKWATSQNHADGQPQLQKCVGSLRRLFSQLRNLEDWLSESLGPGVKTNPVLGFSYREETLIQFSKRDDHSFDFQAGDLVLRQSLASSPSMYAKLAEESSHYSQLSVVTFASQKGFRKILFESIESGLSLKSLTDFEKSKNARWLVLRPYNRDVAQCGSKNASEIFRTQQNSRGKTKFSLKPGLAILSALSPCFREVPFPFFPSKISSKHEVLLQQLGEKSGARFLPGDLEFDPALQMVAEWRNLGLSQESHVRESILNSVFLWMRDFRYQLLVPSQYTVSDRVLRMKRPWPVFDESIQLRKSPLSPMTMATLFSLNAVANTLYEDFWPTVLEFKKETGQNMTVFQVKEKLEHLRVNDLAKYKSYQEFESSHSASHSSNSEAPLRSPPRFHLQFRDLSAR